jgi:hypothetical protein
MMSKEHLFAVQIIRSKGLYFQIIDFNWLRGIQLISSASQWHFAMLFLIPFLWDLFDGILTDVLGISCMCIVFDSIEILKISQELSTKDCICCRFASFLCNEIHIHIPYKLLNFEKDRATEKYFFYFESSD